MITRIKTGIHILSFKTMNDKIHSDLLFPVKFNNCYLSSFCILRYHSIADEKKTFVLQIRLSIHSLNSHEKLNKELLYKLLKLNCFCDLLWRNNFHQVVNAELTFIKVVALSYTRSKNLFGIFCGIRIFEILNIFLYFVKEKISLSICYIIFSLIE